MKIYLLLISLLFSFSQITHSERTPDNPNDDDLPRGMVGDPYYDYMVNCTDKAITFTLYCVDWVVENIGKEGAVLLHGDFETFISRYQNNLGEGITTFHRQTFLIPNNLMYRKQVKSR